MSPNKLTSTVMMSPIQEAQDKAQAVIANTEAEQDNPDTRLIELTDTEMDKLAVQPGAQAGLMRRLSRYAKSTSSNAYLRGLGLFHIKISALASSLVYKRLLDNPQRYNNSELGAVGSYYSRTGRELLAVQSPNQEPQWGKLGDAGEDYQG